MKVIAKNAKATEEANQNLEAEAEALREMVANLTEGKVALTTKVCGQGIVFTLVCLSVCPCVW